MMKQADTIRRLEMCIGLSDVDHATATIASQQRVIQKLRVELTGNVRAVRLLLCV